MGLIPNLNSRLPDPPTPISYDPLTCQCAPTDNIGTALYALVTEPPCSIEVMENAPMRGPAEAHFNRIIAAANITKRDCYITCASKAMTPSGKLDKLWTAKGYRHPDWARLQAQLIDELSAFSGSVIICLGPTAMHLLLDDPRINNINKYRGSVYHTGDFPHLADRLPNKFICLSLDPLSAAPSVDPTNFYIILMDLKKFIRLHNNPELLLCDPPVMIEPTFTEAIDYLNRCLAAPIVSFDIECTPQFITCFSFAISSTESMSIPLMNNSGSYWTVEQETEIWILTAQILGASHIKKICQNGMFDLTFVLRSMNILTDNFWFDTMIAQHICWTDLPKGLDFLTSVYTYHPYYKDEGKQSHLNVIKDWRQYWRYNGKDTAYLFEITAALQSELAVLGPGAEAAMDYSMNLHKPLIEMEFNGILTDQPGIKKRKDIYNRVIRRYQAAIDRLVGHPLNVSSSAQMIKYFYFDLGIPPYVNKISHKPTCDMVALSRIAKKAKPAKGALIAKIIIKLRKLQKLVSTYFDLQVDPDLRLRCAHKICGTVSGRISTARTFFGTGTNLQNQPPIFKHFLLAEPDHLLVECDLAKAEAHVVAFLAGDANMIQAFESGVDVHTFNASKIFNKPLSEVTKSERGLGKRVVHASNYSMGPGTFSDTLAKDFVFISQGGCSKLLQAYADRFPGLKLWHKSINAEIYNSRILHNLFGRPKRFLGMLNDSLLRNAYSYKPQSTVAELMNRGLIKMANDPRLGPDGFDILMSVTVHDSVLFQIPRRFIAQTFDILMIVKEHMTHEFFHKGRSFTIGMDATIGWAWKGQVAEVKSLTQEATTKALKQIGAI